MSEAPDRDQKTEAPTDKRKRDSVEKGDVLQSKELGTALVMLAGAGWLMLAGKWLISASETMLVDGLTVGPREIEAFDPMSAILRLTLPFVGPLVALFAATILASIAAPALLGSLGFRWGAIAVKPDKLNPLSGIARIFGKQGLIELGKSILKVTLLGAIGWWLLSGRIRAMTTLSAPDLRTALGSVGGTFTWAIMVMAAGMGGIAMIDVPAQFMQRAARLRMSKQEVKDEHKQSEGSPELKGQIRRRQFEVLKGSTRKAIAEADVVLVNPTHFAVALRYRPGQDAAPVVVARGRDELAQAIRDFADEQAVPVLRYPPLTRALYFTSRTGHAIREDLYIAVATVLAFVFNLDRAMAEGIVQPVVALPPAMRFGADGQPE